MRLDTMDCVTHIHVHKLIRIHEHIQTHVHMMHTSESAGILVLWGVEQLHDITARYAAYHLTTQVLCHTAGAIIDTAYLRRLFDTTTSSRRLG